MSDKESLRDIYLRKRRTLSKNDVQTRSRLIQQAVIDSTAFNAAESIALYHPIHHEVQTSSLMQAAWEAEKTVYLPQWQPSTRQIRFYRIESNSPLTRTDWGTLEPDPSQTMEQSPTHIDMIVVPGLVFDIRGYRLGYGFGGYDRILATIADKGNPTWGLAYDMQVIDSLPHEPHDIPCSRIMTETRQIEVL